MIAWVIAGLVGVGVAAVQYGRPVTGWGWVVAALRTISVVIAVALVLDAPFGWATAPRVVPALDISASWGRAGDSAGYREAVRRFRALRRDSALVFGDSVRASGPAGAPPTPGDVRSTVRPVVDRALASGRPVAIITDGELDDPEALAALPAGSRVDVIAHGNVPDVAVTGLDAPRAVVDADSVIVGVTVAAGGAATQAGTLTVSLDGKPLATQALAPLEARAERTESVRIVVPAHDGLGVLRAVVTVPGDREARDDTLGAAMEISPAAGTVFVSTAPDYDARYALDVLRGAVALPTRGFFRVAPGQWRVDGTLTPVAEADVRKAAAGAPLVVLHGDTSVFGVPRGATRGSLALLPAIDVTPAGAGEWYATAAPPSPLAGALSGVPWDSLPPIDVGTAGDDAAGGPWWDGLTAARARRFDARAIVRGTTTGRRIVVVHASGLWQWRFRGGVAADAYAALWGGIFDWLAAERPDARAAVPEGGVLRAGDPVRWRRGPTSTDSVTRAVVVSRTTGRTDTLVLRFGQGTTTETAPLPSGVYDVRTTGGPSLLVVNQSREWLPNRSAVRAGPVGGGGALFGGGGPRLRSVWWVYVVLVGALCAEWISRRRLGLR
jgi:hypothetical protein